MELQDLNFETLHLSPAAKEELRKLIANPDVQAAWDALMRTKQVLDTLGLEDNYDA